MSTTTTHQDVAGVNYGNVLYREDTVVREAAVAVIRRITEKVQARAFAAQTLTDPDARDEAVEGALTYAVDALRGIETALSLARGGYVGWDDETSLYFRGVLEGAVIDRDTSFSIHT